MRRIAGSRRPERPRERPEQASALTTQQVLGALGAGISFAGVAYMVVIAPYLNARLDVFVDITPSQTDTFAIFLASHSSGVLASMAGAFGFGFLVGIRTHSRNIWMHISYMCFTLGAAMLAVVTIYYGQISTIALAWPAFYILGFLLPVVSRNLATPFVRGAGTAVALLLIGALGPLSAASAKAGARDHLSMVTTPPYQHPPHSAWADFAGVRIGAAARITETSAAHAHLVGELVRVVVVNSNYVGLIGLGPPNCGEYVLQASSVSWVYEGLRDEDFKDWQPCETVTLWVTHKSG